MTVLPMNHEMRPVIIAGKIHNLVFKENDMRRNLIGLFAAGLAIFILSGCGGDETTGNPDIDQALDDMKFENAPTLGPVARKYFVAMFNSDWEKVWDLQSSETIKMNEGLWESAKNMGDEEEKKMANEAGSAKEYYILRMKKTEKSLEEWAKEITEDEEKFEVIGEEIEEDGKTGWIKAKNLKTSEESKMFRLVKEDGEWKIG